MKFLKTVFFVSICIVSKLEAQSIDQRIDALFPEINRNTPGYAVAVVKDGKLLMAKGYGMSSLEQKIPISESSVFHMASVSKQFTAFAILLLEQMGKLSVDDEVHKYLPMLPDYKHIVKIKDLLYHTSGIRDQWQLWGLLGITEPDLITQKNALDIIYQVKSLHFKPNDEFLYCNSGYTLLAEIVEKVSGKKFNDFCTEYMFAPLKMTHTKVFDDPGLIIPDRVSSYEGNTQKIMRSELNFTTYGATSLFSSATDIINWLSNFNDKKIGGETTFKKFLTKGRLNNGETFDYGMGIFIGNYKGHVFYQHGGTDAGFQTFMSYFPEQKIGIVVLANFSWSNPFSKALKIFDLFLPVTTTDQSDKKNNNISQTTVAADKKSFYLYEGNYETPWDKLVRIKDDNGYLTVLFPERMTADTLDKISDSLFLIRRGGQLKFQKKKDTGFTEFTYKNNLDGYDAKKVVYKSYQNNELDQFAGTFFSHELQTAYKVSVQNDSLVIFHVRNGTMHMLPRVQDRFSVNKWFMRSVIFKRDKSGKVTGFSVDATRSRDVYFTKL